MSSLFHFVSKDFTRDRSIVSSEKWPESIIASSSSARRISNTWCTPSAPLTANPQNIGRPTITARAPRARALSASVPRRMPPSRYTSQRPATASTISGSASILAMAESSCRPPWFETMTPYTPRSSASSASSAVRMPLSRIGSDVTVFSQSRVSQVGVKGM